MKKFFASIVLLGICGAVFAAAVGEMAPELDLGPALKGKKFRLADMRGKQYTVIHFWKTRCPACVKAVPMINELVKLYRNKVAFMAVGTDFPANLRQEKHWNEFQCPVVSDSFLKTVQLYLHKNHQFPMDAVVGMDGKLLWLGPTAMLASVLGDIMEGKFDAAGAAALDRFNREMTDAMSRKDYPRALKTLRARLKVTPEDQQLAVSEAYLLAANCGKVEEALTVLDKNIAKYPQAFRFYQAKLQILQQYTPPADARRIRHYQAMAGAFSTRPRLLIGLASSMMKQKVGSYELLGVYHLAFAAYHSPALRDPLDRGRAAAALARSYYYIGMPERAVIYQAEAAELLKKTTEGRRCAMDLEFYRSTLVAAEAVKKLESEKK